MAKPISEIRPAVSPRSTQSIPAAIDHPPERTPLALEPVPESTASLRKKLKAKRRQQKQQEQQRRQALRQISKHRNRTPRWIVQPSPTVHDPDPEPMGALGAPTQAEKAQVNQQIKRVVRHQSLSQWWPLRRLAMLLGVTSVACGP